MTIAAFRSTGHADLELREAMKAVASGNDCSAICAST
jgi:hypothetical protein